MRSLSNYRDTLATVAIAFLIYMALQAAIVIMHEYTHAGSAWLLGYSATPFTVVWGSVLTLRGFDEGVPYDRLFPAPGHPAEAVIGFMPDVIHTIMVVAGLLLLQCRWTQKRKWVFITLFLWTVINLAELLSYIVMRPFPKVEIGVIRLVSPSLESAAFVRQIQATALYVRVIRRCCAGR